MGFTTFFSTFPSFIWDISAATAVGIKYILNKILIPLSGFWGGINGAAISNLISHIVVTLFCYICLKKEINIKIRKINILKAIASTTIFIIISKVIFNFLQLYINSKISLILSLIIGILFYLFSIINFKICFATEKIEKIFVL